MQTALGKMRKANLVRMMCVYNATGSTLKSLWSSVADRTPGSKFLTLNFLILT